MQTCVTVMEQSKLNSTEDATPAPPTRNHKAPQDRPQPQHPTEAVMHLAANLCTVEESSAPIARTQCLADATARLLELLDPDLHCDAVMFTTEFLRNVTCYTKVSIMPDWECPEAGGSAFLALPPAPLLDQLRPLLFVPAADTISAAVAALGNLVRVPDKQAYVQERDMDKLLVDMLVHPQSAVMRAAAGALVNLASSPRSCVRLTGFNVGRPLVRVLLLSLSEFICGAAATCSAQGHKGQEISTAMRKQTALAALGDCKELLQLLCALLQYHAGRDTSQAEHGGHQSASASVSEHEEDSGTSKSSVCSRKSDASEAQVECELGEDFWQDANQLLCCLESINEVVESSESVCGELVYRAKDLLLELMEEDSSGADGRPADGSGQVEKQQHPQGVCVGTDECFPVQAGKPK